MNAPAMPRALAGHAVTGAQTTRLPWTVWTSAAATISVAVGGLWDISWHISVGRDTFWTPPHMLIQLCAAIGGLSALYLIARTTFSHGAALKARSVGVLGLRAPLGAFVSGWGALAMVTSAPFDNWWHAAYGLDVKVLSPPHAVLMLGSVGVVYGGFLLIMAEMNNAPAAAKARMETLFIALVGVLMTAAQGDLIEYSLRIMMHSAVFYRVFAVPFPFDLMVVRRVSGKRWACTLAAGIYTALSLGQEWILPLFPAQQKLSPVYNRVPHMVPLGFPVMVIVPALLLDWSWPRLLQWKSRVARAVAQGALFLGGFLAAQWPLASFLITPRSANWVFGTHYWMYFIPPDSPAMLDRFMAYEPSRSAFYAGMLMALGSAMLFCGVGSGVGGWLKKVRR